MSKKLPDERLPTQLQAVYTACGEKKSTTLSFLCCPAVHMQRSKLIDSGTDPGVGGLSRGEGPLPSVGARIRYWSRLCVDPVHTSLISEQQLRQINSDTSTSPAARH